MAAYNGNNYFVKLGSVNVSDYVKSVRMEPSAETKETTRGNRAHRQRRPGLRDNKMTIVIGYEIGLAFINALTPGLELTIEYGPEGNTAGKPKNVQPFISEAAPFEVVVGKDEVAFETSWVESDAPTVDLMAGGVY